MGYRSSLSGRITASILISFAWLAFLLLFLAFGLGSFDVGQTLAILLVSGLVAAGAIGAMWARWILRG
ncbi:MAG: hypothetical protein AABX97_07820 [Candidatus Thermoplasmatota archaeon]